MTAFDSRQKLAIAMDLHREGKLREAVTLYREILTRDPNNAAALNAMGMAAAQNGQIDHAATMIARAVELSPGDAAFLNNLGAIRMHQGRAEDAEACWLRAIELVPDYLAPVNSLAQHMFDTRRYDEAIELWQHVIKLAPNHAPTLRKLGNALRQVRRYKEAHAVASRAEELAPGDPENLNNLADSLYEQGQPIEAAQIWRQAADANPTALVLRNNLLLMLHYDPNQSNEQLFQEHLRFGSIARSLGPRIPLPAPDCDPDRRIRIGYLSPNFNSHAVAKFVEPILREHNHSQFEITCYHDSPRTDAVTARFKPFADRWHDVANLSTDAMTQLIAGNSEDILVDLTGHISGSRLAVFARKPAPIQATYIGYQNTTGLEAMDYRITDAVADLPDAGRFYTERLVRLPCFFCYQISETAVDIGPLPAQSSGIVTFGSLNMPAKLNERVIALWSRLMHEVKNSRMILLIGALGEGDERFVKMFAEYGIDPTRVTFVPRAGRIEYLNRYNQIDIALDPFPFSGHTTTCDALWMGVPVVTLAGDRYAARMSTSVLTHLPALEWIAENPDQYVKIAARLAADLNGLAEIRGGLRNRVETSTITNSATFTRNLEASYRKMWVDYCKSR